jgi:hypothetical protein
MTLLVAFFGVLIALLGATGLFSPSTLLGRVDSARRTRRGLYAVIALRLVLGVISIVAAGSVPVIGLERVHAMVDWWAARPPLWIRAWACVAIAFGGFLIHAAA